MTKEQLDLADLYKLKEILYQAGEIGMKYFGKEVSHHFKDDKSPVSEADLEINEFLENKLRNYRPQYGWLSEESSEHIHKPDERSFIVDPIDGTRGFIAGDKQWCISVAIEEKGEIAVGALYCPALEEFYGATKNDGLVFSCHENLQKKNIRTKNNEIIVGISSREIKKYKERFLDLKINDRKITVVAEVPSLAYNIILCGLGEYDAIVIRSTCKPWDIAAADLILEKMGGKLVEFSNKNVTYGDNSAYDNYLFAYRNNTQYDNLSIELKKIIS